VFQKLKVDTNETTTLH